MKIFFPTKEIIQEELVTSKVYSEKSIKELSEILDKELFEKLYEEDLLMFSKRDIADLVHISTKYLNNILATLPESIQFKNTRSLLSINATIHYFFTPFIISRLKHKKLVTVIHEIAKL